MYTYQRAFGVTNDNPKGLVPVEIEDKLTTELVRIYSKLIIVLKDQFLPDLVALDMINYFNDFNSFNGTIQDWLDSKASVPLKVSDNVPNGRYNYVTCHDIQYRWFSLLPGDARLSSDRQDTLNAASAPDIRIRRTDNHSIDYKKLARHALFTINGHLNRAISTDKEIFLLGAGKHFNTHDNFHITCLNFYGVSSLSTIPLEEERVNITESSMNNVTVRVKSPVEPNGKKIYMSIMGRLFFSDVVQHTGNGNYLIRTDKVDWFTLLFDSKRLIDTSEILPKEQEVVDKGFFNKDFFKKLLLHPNTFIIVLDNSEIDVYTKPVSTYSYPFTYHTTETRELPLLTGGGLLPKYFVRRIINRRLLDIDLGVQQNYLNKTTGINNEGNIYHGFASGFEPSTLNNGYLLYIRGLSQLPTGDGEELTPIEPIDPIDPDPEEPGPEDPDPEIPEIPEEPGPEPEPISLVDDSPLVIEHDDLSSVTTYSTDIASLVVGDYDSVRLSATGPNGETTNYIIVTTESNVTYSREDNRFPDVRVTDLIAEGVLYEDVPNVTANVTLDSNVATEVNFTFEESLMEETRRVKVREYTAESYLVITRGEVSVYKKLIVKHLGTPNRPPLNLTSNEPLVFTTTQMEESMEWVTQIRGLVDGGYISVKLVANPGNGLKDSVIKHRAFTHLPNDTERKDEIVNLNELPGNNGATEGLRAYFGNNNVGDRVNDYPVVNLEDSQAVEMTITNNIIQDAYWSYVNVNFYLAISNETNTVYKEIVLIDDLETDTLTLIEEDTLLIEKELTQSMDSHEYIYPDTLVVGGYSRVELRFIKDTYKHKLESQVFGSMEELATEDELFEFFDEGKRQSYTLLEGNLLVSRSTSNNVIEIYSEKRLGEEEFKLLTGELNFYICFIDDMKNIEVRKPAKFTLINNDLLEEPEVPEEPENPEEPDEPGPEDPDPENPEEPEVTLLETIDPLEPIIFVDSWVGYENNLNVPLDNIFTGTIEEAKLVFYDSNEEYNLTSSVTLEDETIEDINLDTSLYLGEYDNLEHLTWKNSNRFIKVNVSLGETPSLDISFIDGFIDLGFNNYEISFFVKVSNELNSAWKEVNVILETEPVEEFNFKVDNGLLVSLPWLGAPNTRVIDLEALVEGEYDAVTLTVGDGETKPVLSSIGQQTETGASVKYVPDIEPLAQEHSFEIGGHVPVKVEVNNQTKKLIVTTPSDLRGYELFRFNLYLEYSKSYLRKYKKLEIVVFPTHDEDIDMRRRWVDVTGERVQNEIYFNDSGDELVINANGTTGSSNTGVIWYAEHPDDFEKPDKITGTYGGSYGTGNSSRSLYQGWVPKDYYYMFRKQDATNIQYCYELRADYSKLTLLSPNVYEHTVKMKSLHSTLDLRQFVKGDFDRIELRYTIGKFANVHQRNDNLEWISLSASEPGGLLPSAIGNLTGLEDVTFVQAYAGDTTTNASMAIFLESHESDTLNIYSHSYSGARRQGFIWVTVCYINTSNGTEVRKPMVISFTP